MQSQYVGESVLVWASRQSQCSCKNSSDRKRSLERETNINEGRQGVKKTSEGEGNQSMERQKKRTNKTKDSKAIE